MGLDQILRQLFKSGQNLHSTKKRPPPEPFVLNASDSSFESNRIGLDGVFTTWPDMAKKS